MSTRKITIAIGAAAAFGLIATPFAVADPAQPAGVTSAPTTVAFGADGKLVDGNTVAEWQISNLKPSTDVLSQHLNGTLWEATAEYTAERGNSQPFVPNLNARTAAGENYRVLWGAATPQGINPAGLAEGQESKGKIYFDVTGAAPTSVVYTDGDREVIKWQGTEAPAAAAPAAAPARGTAPAATTPAPAA
ncbi:MPT63 family protein, partial [Mycolicibacterium mucogenicum]|uniref:MPT63 family protein n=1 Tax=Mycolicibacterium mucogenicum TaxID=56689 RepID=UPI000A4ECAAF